MTRDKGAGALEKRASLLRVDSVHGPFPGTVEADAERNALLVNGRLVHMISAPQPEDIDYTAWDRPALIIDNTGAFRDEQALKRHLSSKGASRVLLTAPGKGVPNIVHGVNQKLFDPSKMDVFSAASCTTNAIVPVLKVINDKLGIEKGHIETIHAYTNDQNLVDNMHKKYRRGRGNNEHVIKKPEKRVDKAIPGLVSNSSAIRVPVPDGSLAILNLTLEKETSKNKLNELLRKVALNGDLVEQICYHTSNELVSSDIIGNSCPSVFDSQNTLVHSDNKTAVIMSVRQ